MLSPSRILAVQNMYAILVIYRLSFLIQDTTANDASAYTPRIKTKRESETYPYFGIPKTTIPALAGTTGTPSVTFAIG